MDGIEIAENLRERFDIPSIYLAAYADESLLERARSTEPYGYLVKPVKEAELRATLEIALSKRHRKFAFNSDDNYLSKTSPFHAF